MTFVQFFSLRPEFGSIPIQLLAKGCQAEVYREEATAVDGLRKEITLAVPRFVSHGTINEDG